MIFCRSDPVNIRRFNMSTASSATPSGWNASHLRTSRTDSFAVAPFETSSKESVLDILKWLAFHPDGVAEEAVEMLNLRMLTKLDLENIISKVVESNQTLVQENGSKALGRMINLVMGEVRGRADPRHVTELLRTRLEQVKA